MGWCFLEGTKVGMEIAPKENMTFLVDKVTRSLFKLKYISNVIFLKTHGLIVI